MPNSNKKTMTRVRKNTQSRYDWAIAGDAYLGTAFYLCEEANQESSFFKKIGFQSHHPSDHLIWPIMYNFKHGIELHLKCLSGVASSKIEHKHDLKHLITNLGSKTRSNKQRKQQEKSIFDKLQQDAWPIIEKYYNGRYIRNNQKPKDDRMNEAERFPHSVYKIPPVHKWLNTRPGIRNKKTTLEQIRDDIKTLHKLLWTAKRDIYKIDHAIR